MRKIGCRCVIDEQVRKTCESRVMSVPVHCVNSLYRKAFLRKEPRRVHLGIVLKPLVHKHTKNKIYIQLLREVQMVHYSSNEADISTYGTSSDGRI